MIGFGGRIRRGCPVGLLGLVDTSALLHQDSNYVIMATICCMMEGCPAGRTANVDFGTLLDQVYYGVVVSNF
ncbi:hypothetical protein P167DRAFT_588915 [Morchella conica CCBAS932]|uniref:Uncharacterized protein n=1 Tax=Morchella conica CCBAS932 TaxID=1392247 RepID=A0A3N4KR94_9PEZI|nr:hypothetical protein P167DRAFT_588915 [Morchella conica CCBAS932]